MQCQKVLLAALLLANPNSPLPLYFQGLYLREQGAFKAAEASLTEALALDPENAAIYAELAQVMLQQGYISTAETLYQAAIKVAEDDHVFRLLLANFYMTRGYRISEMGIPLVETILATDTENAEAYDMLGWMQFLSGSNGEEMLRMALELEPEMASARYHLARQIESLGQIDFAVVEYRRVIDWDKSGFFRERALKDLQRLGKTP